MNTPAKRLNRFFLIAQAESEQSKGLPVDDTRIATTSDLELPSEDMVTLYLDLDLADHIGFNYMSETQESAGSEPVPVAKFLDAVHSNGDETMHQEALKKIAEEIYLNPAVTHIVWETQEEADACAPGAAKTITIDGKTATLDLGAIDQKQGDLLAEALAKLIMKSGMLADGVLLTGPHLLQFAGELVEIASEAEQG